MDSIEWGKDGLNQAPPATTRLVTPTTGRSLPQQPHAYPVLIVDDDDAIRDTLAALLEDTGYTVSVAATGREALAVLRAAPTPVVVLLDLIMPEPDGRGVLRAVATDQRLARRHGFIIVTAASETLLDQTQAEMSRLDAGLTLDTVRKPFDIDAMVAVVTRIEQRLHAVHGARGLPQSGSQV